MKRAFPLLALLVLAPLARAADRETDSRQVTRERMDRLASEIADFQVRTGKLPSGGEGIESLARDSDLEDGWGHSILYVRVPGGYALISLGADGAPGGEGENADLVRLVQ